MTLRLKYSPLTKGVLYATDGTKTLRFLPAGRVIERATRRGGAWARWRFHHVPARR